MTVQEILDTYGNIVIPNRILIQLGIKEEDVMLDAEEVKKFVRSSQPYVVIDRLKKEIWIFISRKENIEIDSCKRIRFEGVKQMKMTTRGKVTLVIFWIMIYCLACCLNADADWWIW